MYVCKSIEGDIYSPNLEDKRNIPTEDIPKLLKWFKISSDSEAALVWKDDKVPKEIKEYINSFGHEDLYVLADNSTEIPWQFETSWYLVNKFYFFDENSEQIGEGLIIYH